MSIPIRHQMHKDLAGILSKELTDAGFKTNPDYPCEISAQPDASISGHSDYYYARNIAYQYISIINRYIHIASRPVYWSKELIGKYRIGKLTPGQVAAINVISSISVSGQSLIRFMSFQIAKADYEDKLFTEWRIAHLHLDSTPSKEAKHQTKLAHFVQRTGPVLFVFVQDTGLYLIDILEHGPQSWSNRELFEIVHRNWPAVLDKYRMPGVHSSVDSVVPTSDIHQARKMGMSVIMAMSDGTTYLPPGGGLSRSGANAQVVAWAAHLLESCKTALEAITRHADEAAAGIEREKGVKVTELDLMLTLNQRDEPVFVERTSGMPFRVGSNLPQSESSSPLSFHRTQMGPSGDPVLAHPLRPPPQ